MQKKGGSATQHFMKIFFIHGSWDKVMNTTDMVGGEEGAEPPFLDE